MLGSFRGNAWLIDWCRLTPLFAEQDVEAGIGAVDYLRRQRSVQHLPDRGEVEAAKAQQGGVGSGGYVSTFISKAQVCVASEPLVLHSAKPNTQITIDPNTQITIGGQYTLERSTCFPLEKVHPVYLSPHIPMSTTDPSHGSVGQGEPPAVSAQYALRDARRGQPLYLQAQLRGRYVLVP